MAPRKPNRAATITVGTRSHGDWAISGTPTGTARKTVMSRSAKRARKTPIGRANREIRPMA
jgi:hypothetical protein